MSATSARPQTRPGSRTTSSTGGRRGTQSRTETVFYIGPWQNALEGALAAVAAVAAMALVALAALLLMGASSVGSLWSLTMTVTAMAVGGSVSSGADASADSGGMSGLAGLFGGGGGMGPSVSGGADAVPLGVTLVGVVVLWIGFSRRLRRGQQRRFTGAELAVRAAGTAIAALVTMMIVAGMAHGSAKLPSSAMQGMGGLGGKSSSGGSAGNPFSQLLGGSGGSGSNPFSSLLGAGASSQFALTYQVSAITAGFGAVLWAAVALGGGCLVSRPVRLPLGGVLDRVRPAWAPSLSPVVRTLLVLAAVPLVALGVVGAVVGGRAGTAAGAVLLLAPNLLAVFLSLGVGSGWTAEVHPVKSDSSSPLAGLMGSIGGKSGLGGAQQPDRTEHLRALSAGGWPLWLVALAVTGLLLVGCAYRAARVMNPAHKVPLHPYQGPMAEHLGMAERFAVVTAVVLGMAAWLGAVSGNFAISIFGSEMGGMRAALGGSVPATVVFGLLVGGAAGFTGSLLSRVRGPQKAV